MSGDKSWSDAKITALSEVLSNLNGELSFSNVGTDIGRLPSTEYLVLHSSWKDDHVANDNKSIGANTKFDVKRFTAIAAYQYEKLRTVISNDDHLIKVSLLRAFLVSRKVLSKGAKAFHVKHNEVEFTNAVPTGETMKVFADFHSRPNSNEIMRDLHELSVLAPAFASIQFIKTNHHYLANTDYEMAYDRHFRSACKDHLRGILPYGLLFHTAIHWMGPYAMRILSENYAKLKYLPDGIIRKMTLAPAGTALLTSSCAIFESMQALPMYAAFKMRYERELTLMKSVRDAIMAKPLDYHIHYDLFSSKNARDSPQFLSAMASASALAPYAQAFIEVFCKGSALGATKSLKKHAESNPVIYQVFLGLFRKVVRALRSYEDITQALDMQIVKTGSNEEEDDGEEVVG